MKRDASRQRPSLAGRWEIRRGEKIFGVPNSELLLKIYREGRFTGQEMLRAVPSKDWLAVESIDWDWLEKQLRSVKQSESQPSSQKSPEIERTAQEVSISPTKPTAGSPQKAASKDWWGEEAQTQKSDSQHAAVKLTSRSAVILATFLLAIVVCGSLLGWYFTRGVKRSDSAPARIAMASEPNVPSTPPKNQNESVMRAQETPINQQLPEQQSSPSPTETDVEDGAQDAIVKETTEYTDDSSKPQPNLLDDAPLEKASQEAKIATAEPKARESEQQSEEVADKSEVAMSDAEQGPLQSSSSESQLDKKTELEHNYELVFGAIQNFRQINKNLFDTRMEMISSIKKSDEIKADIQETENNVKLLLSRMAQDEKLLANLSAALAGLNQSNSKVSSADSAQQIRIQIDATKGDWKNTSNACQRAQNHGTNLVRQLAAEAERFAIFQKTMVEVVNKEVYQTSESLDCVDFFGDIPAENHRRLFLEASNWTASEPDFMLGYLVESAAALHLGKLDVPDKNLKKMRAQMQLMPQSEIEIRRPALVRLETMALVACALAEVKKGKPENAERYLKAGYDFKQPRADLRLASAMSAIKRKKNGDAIQHVKDAIRIDKGLVKTYSNGLNILLESPNVDESVISKQLEQLTTRLDKDDFLVWPQHRFWLVAAKAAGRIHDTEKYESFLDRANHPFLTETIADLRSNKSTDPSDGKP